MTDLLSLIIVGVMVLAAVIVSKAGANARFRTDLVAYELRFPRGLKPAQVAIFFVGLSGLAGSRWQRANTPRGVVFETVADHTGIRHRVLIPREHADVVLANFRAHLPAVRMTEVPDAMISRPTLAAQLGLSNARRSLATSDPVAVVTGLVTSLQPLPVGGSIVVQSVVMPLGPVAAPSSPSSKAQTRSGIRGLFNITPPSREELAAEKVKRSGPLFAVTLRLGVATTDPAVAKRLMARVLAAFHAANAPGVHLYRRMLPTWMVARSLVGRFLPVLVPPCLLSVPELSMLVGFPLGNAAVPGVQLGTSRLLAPSADIPSRGRVVAMANFPGAERPLALSVSDALRHVHVIGPTGVGKSTLLLGMITQDMAAGHGVIVIDPKSDLAADVRDRVPADRVDDVTVLDLSDASWPVGLNLLAGPPETAELRVDQVVGTMKNLWASSWGPRTDDILRASLLTLIGLPGMTICEVPLLLTDSAFRRWAIGQINEPIALEPFWGWYEALSDAERTQAIGPVMNKLRSFLLRRSLRNTLGQATPKLDLAEVLREGRILIVPSAKGVIGEDAAALFGSLLFARLWQSVQMRAADAPESRRPVFCYIDEFQDVLRLPTSIADVLAQSRSLGMGTVLAHQHLGQLPRTLKEDVLANARSRVIFQTAAADAQRLGREVAPYLTPAELQALGAYEVVATLSAGGQVAPPVTGRTVLPPAPAGLGEAVRARSRAVYGEDRDVVEAAIRSRHTTGRPGPGAVGRTAVPR